MLSVKKYIMYNFAILNTSLFTCTGAHGTSRLILCYKTHVFLTV